MAYIMNEEFITRIAQAYYSTAALWDELPEDIRAGFITQARNWVKAIQDAGFHIVGTGVLNPRPAPPKL